MADKLPSDLFAEMADRIRAIKPGEFAGAILIIPPAMQQFPAEAIELLMVSPSPDLAHFYATVKHKIDFAAAEFEQRARQGNPFGR